MNAVAFVGAVTVDDVRRRERRERLRLAVETLQILAFRFRFWKDFDCFATFCNVVFGEVNGTHSAGSKPT